MTATLAQKQPITAEVILTYTDRDQDFVYIQLPLTDEGAIDEATVLLEILSSVDPQARAFLCKASLCLRIPSDADIDVIAPWLHCKDSPLCNGKLWLKQHLHT
jgi:hypothetical protein